ncbi:family 43 glycosylhydrolase [Flavobacterium piscis]|uniref:DUF6597 domain-containing protein n=1 Tax=Flavobacterium piscis TaxID=1114874 RepID=A0ABU1Y7V0_9FLAO|nr:family 43 glycosylhydrolase [Flavobacterium piscis]MDR7210308.1 hypothetical protein [Flavobacterium piscis]
MAYSLSSIPTGVLKEVWMTTQWERIFPDVCAGLVVNLGDDCLTDKGQTKMEHSKTYVVGVMTSFKESYIKPNTKLHGVCIKPGMFSSLYTYTSQKELTDTTIEFDKRLSFNTSSLSKDSEIYLDTFFTSRAKDIDYSLRRILVDIALSKGMLSIREVASKNCITVRQLERNLVYKEGLYYCMWAGGRCDETSYKVRYAVSKNIEGPYEEAANSPILKTDEKAGISGPGHHSITEIDGCSFMFYHRQDLIREARHVIIVFLRFRKSNLKTAE